MSLKMFFQIFAYSERVRLAEYCPNDKVLLIEAGPRHESIMMSTMAMGWEGLHHTDWDWRYTSQPNAKANDRQIHLPRGKFLGGSSGANGTLMLRGVREDCKEIFIFMMSC